MTVRASMITRPELLLGLNEMLLSNPQKVENQEHLCPEDCLHCLHNHTLIGRRSAIYLLVSSTTLLQYRYEEVSFSN